MNRCKICGAICPDFSELCDCCCYIEQETKEDGEISENYFDDEEFDEEETI